MFVHICRAIHYVNMFMDLILRLYDSIIMKYVSVHLKA